MVSGNAESVPPPKGKAVAVVRTPKQAAAAAARAIGAEAAELAEREQTEAEAAATRVAQIANLLIAGWSIEQVAAKTGNTPADIERMLSSDTARYVRTQASLRVFVRNYLSSKYTALLESVWDQSIDKTNPNQLDYQDRSVRILDKMGRLHGAEAPTQTEVKVESAPEAVEALVRQLAASKGQDFDASVFDEDVVDGEVIADTAQMSLHDLERASQAVEDDESGGDL